MWKCAGESDALRVLLVEDDDLAAAQLGRALRFGRFDVVIASSANRALLEIAAEPPDVVLIDLHVRPVAVIKLVRSIRAREDGRDTPVAILTGDYYGFQVALEDELKILKTALFYKPLLPEQLVMSVRALAEREI